MADEWRPEVGDVVQCVGTVVKADRDDDTVLLKLRDYNGDSRWWLPWEAVRPNASAPAEMDDVDAATYFLLSRLRAGEKWRPKAWANSTMLRDGHCRIDRQHTYVECTPATVGVSVSPAIAGVRDAIRKYGLAWEPVSDAPAPAAMDDVAVLRRAVSILEEKSNTYAGADAGNYLTCLADEIEAARRLPTPLDLLREYDRIQTDAWPGGPGEMPKGHPGFKLWTDARSAIAAAEAKGDV